MKQWLLIVFDGSEHPRLMKSLGLSESKSKAGQYVGFYALNSTPFLHRQIDRLKEAGLHGIAKKVEQRTRPERPRGKHARAAYDAQKHTSHYVKKTMPKVKAIAEAQRIEDLKRKRTEQDEAKRRREFARQAAQATARDQQRHAEHVLALLKHPVGSA